MKKIALKNPNFYYVGKDIMFFKGKALVAKNMKFQYNKSRKAMYRKRAQVAVVTVVSGKDFRSAKSNL